MINGHGDDSYQYEQKILSDFSSNVYPKADHSDLKAYLRRRFSDIRSYPEPEPSSLEARWAKCFDVPKGSVCMTNGATEAIYLIAQAFRCSRTAILQPTFNEYADACRMHAHELTFLGTLDWIPDNVHLVWICNPNNPTGTVHDYRTLEALIRQHSRKIFVIDQSYEEFTLKRVSNTYEGYCLPNVLLVHSMTKPYDIPGLRLGYITGRLELVNHIRAFRMPWSVNQLAIAAADFVFEDGMFFEQPLSEYLEECALLRDHLQALGVMEVMPTDTHFMLACLHSRKAEDLKEYLINKHQILIRDASNFEGLSHGHLRICAQTPPENERLVNAIRQWFAL